MIIIYSIVYYLANDTCSMVSIGYRRDINAGRITVLCIRFREVKDRGTGLDVARASRTNVYRRLSISPRRRDHSGLQVDRQTVQASAAEASLTFSYLFCH